MYEYIESLSNAIGFMLSAWNAGYNFYFNPQQFSDGLEAYVISKTPKE
jgi:hypothetical protein